MEVRRTGLALTFILLALVPASHTQTVTGQISGTVVDPGGAVVVGAGVSLTNDVTKQTREYRSDANGNFLFPDLVPGTYNVRVMQSGFKAYAQSGIVLSAQEKLALHELRLEVGEVTATVEVQADATHVATDSSDHTTGVNLIQIQNTPIRGRDFQAIIKDLAGVQDLGTHDARGWGTQTPTVNGGQQGQVLLTLDGIASQDSGAPGINTYQAPSVDAIAEVKLLTSNYNAEYGSRNGGQLNLTVKSGTAQFHGSAYYYWRHEQLNANEFFNNAQSIVKPKYRFQNPGGTIGGPVYLPGTHFNKDHDKLFFFFSYDYVHNVQANAVNHYTMPTALEKTGDFSQSINPNGSPIVIRDPSNGNPFPGNVIPAAQQSPIGQAMLNVFPNPNTTDPTGLRQYNYNFIPVNANPRSDKILRVDYNISSRDTMFVRLLQDYQDSAGNGAILGAAGDGWGQFPHSYHIPSAGAATTYVHTFRPNLINELTWGINKAHQGNSPTDAALYNASLLPLKGPNGQPLNLPTIFGNGVNYLNLLPNVSFGLPAGFSAQSAPTPIPNIPGGANGNAFGFDSRWPFDGTDSIQNVSDNVTWIKGAHTLKSGFYFEHDARNVSVYSTYNTAGTYYFGSDLGNPVDTGDPFSNALAGSLFGYGQDNKKQVNRARYKQYEWFAQDTWRVTHRLTIDYGLRFQILGTVYSSGATLGLFDGSAYSPTQAGQLLFPTCTVAVGNGVCPAASKASVDLKTGAIYPYVRQGTFDPATYAAGSLPFSGVVQYHTDLFHTPGVQYNPRIGFAWDVFGNGKNAVRGGFGIFHGRAFGVDTIGASGAGVGPMAAPPNFQAPLILNTTIASLAGSPVLYTPQNVNGGSINYKPPVTYDWSFGIQRDLGRGFILDVSYLGYVAHHIWTVGGTTATLGPNNTNVNVNTGVDFNAVAPLTIWTPAGGANSKYLDPTSSNGGTGGFYSPNLIRALAGGYQGWGAINAFTQTGESLYDALQVQFNKRLGGRFQYGANYTWSKTLLYTRYQWTADQLNKNVTSNRPHAVNMNFVYSVPEGSRLWKNGLSQQVLDGWHLAGIGTFYFGQPLTVNCSAVASPIGYWTGTPTGGIPFRCQQNGDLWLASGATPNSVGSTADPRLWYNFNPASFSLPPATSLGIGNTPPTLTYGPGVETVDLSVYKDFKLGGERRNLELKAEAFNALNHFNPGAPNTVLNINFKTGKNTNTNFGRVLPTQVTTNGIVYGGAQVQARHMVLSARFTF